MTAVTFIIAIYVFVIFVILLLLGKEVDEIRAKVDSLTPPKEKP